MGQKPSVTAFFLPLLKGLRPSWVLGLSLSEALVRGSRAPKPAERPIFQAACRHDPVRSPGSFDGLILFRVFSNPGKRLEFLRIQLQPCFIHKRLRLLNLCLCIACPLHTRMRQPGLHLLTMELPSLHSTRMVSRPPNQTTCQKTKFQR